MSKQIQYTLLTEQTAECIARIIEKVYSEGYDTLVLPKAQEAWQAHAGGKEFVALAFDGHDAIAMVTLKRASDNNRVYELGMLSVVKEYRQSDVANELLRFARREFAKFVEFDIVFMENISTHYYSQRKAVQNGAVDCAVAFSAMPELADSSKRLSYIISFLENETAKPEPIYIPRRYADILLKYYDGLKPRQIMPASYGVPEEQASITVMHDFPTLKLLRFRVLEIGHDFLISAYNAINKYENYSIYVYLPLSSPYCSYAVDYLVKEGFFIAGVLPFWFGSDGLLMQRNSGEMGSMKIYSRKAKFLASLALEDKKRV